MHPVNFQRNKTMKAMRQCFQAAALVACTLVSGLAHAQASRTWVSGVGDDANPCSRTAPCKTFAGAISKTATGGEISVLDPGGFGAVTVTKSITIDGGSNVGSILSSGTSGVIVNAAGATVTLRNLSINGTGTVTSVGVRIIAAAKVFIEDSVIFGHVGADPSGRGISDVRAAGGQLIVTNTTVRGNAQTGLVLQPGGGVPLDVTLRGVNLIGNANAGISVTNGAIVTMTASNAAGNGNIGVYIEQLAGSSRLFMSDSVISDNPIGLYVGNGAPVVRLSNTVITANDTGVNNIGAGSIFSYGNNRISGNTAGNTPTVSPVGPI
jgi:hypothetical protein